MRMSLSDAQEQRDEPQPEGRSPSKGDPQLHPIVDFAVRTTELDEIEHLTNTLITPNRMSPLARDGAVDGVFQLHGLRDFCSFTTSYGQSMRVSLREEAIDERIAFTMASGGNGQLIMDQREFSISERHGVVFSAGPLRILNYQEDCETSVLVMNGRKISECCAKLLGRELDTDVRFDTGFDLSTGNGQSWVRLFQYATAELSNPHSLFRHLPAARQQLEQTVLTGFLLGHAHTYSDALLRPQAAAAPHYVKRAEAYIESHFAEPLSLAEIAAQSGVSARSLQNGFQNFRNMTPMAFLRSIRLQRAHRALLAADPAIARVTEIALACGFNHMGEFASAYRHAFGETPRQTLGRARAA